MEKNKLNKYTCNEYRAEMILLGLNKRLHQKDVSEKEREELKKEIERIEAAMGM